MTENNMLLTSEELESLTNKKRCDAQVKALNAMGVPFILRGDGSPAVSRLFVDRKLGAIDKAPVRLRKEPNWSGANAPQA